MWAQTLPRAGVWVHGDLPCLPLVPACFWCLQPVALVALQVYFGSKSHVGFYSRVSVLSGSCKARAGPGARAGLLLVWGVL